MTHGRSALVRAGAAALFMAIAPSAFAQCRPSIPMDQFIYRFGISETVNSDDDLRVLINNPTMITVRAAAAAPDDPAAIVATTECHALYPVSSALMVEVLKDADILPEIIPELVVHRTICRSGPDMIKQQQRTEFNVLFFKFGTEYLIDVHYAINGPEEYGSYWGLYESLDGRLAYQFGSWYFQDVTVDGQDYAYVRHFTVNGLKSRIPGLRTIFELSARNKVVTMMNAIYEEAARRQQDPALVTAEERDSD